MKPFEYLHDNRRCRSVSCTHLSLLARVVAQKVGDPASSLCCMTQSRSLHPHHSKWVANGTPFRRASVCISLLTILHMFVVTIMFLAQQGSMVWGLSPELPPNPAAVKGGTVPAVAWLSLSGCCNLFAAPICSQGSCLRLHNSPSKVALLISSFSLAHTWHGSVLESKYGITGDVSAQISLLCHLKDSIQRLQGSFKGGAVFSASV